MRRWLMLGTTLMCATPMITAHAQQFTIYGLGGFVADLVGPAYKFPQWVQNYYGTPGAFSIGIYESGYVNIREPQSTSLGEFSTPQPAEVGPGGNAIVYNNADIGNFGIWQQRITSLQYNYGIYFAGEPSTYTTSWSNAIDGTFSGKAVGFYRGGYMVKGLQGTVNIQIVSGSVRIQFSLADVGSSSFHNCTGYTTAQSQGFTFDCTGLDQDYIYNSSGQGTLESFDIQGGGQPLFFGLNAPAVSGLLEATNITGEPNGGATLIVAFGACNKNAGTSCSIQ